jgi:peptidyl-prolyl cis-trans isomerase B (cyclophilin B)
MLLRTAVVALLATAALVGCSGDDDGGASARDDGPTSGTKCSYREDARGAAKDVSPPPSVATLTGEVPATISTTAGELDVKLDADSTPCTVNSFVSLADQGYFDDTPCHRLTTAAAGIYVLQCGDPTGTGTAGPGYSFPDELTGKETYPAGTLAMANAGPDTNGS